MSSIYLSQETQASLKQSQQLLMNLSMRQALHVLQLPQLELSEWLKEEIENNPILEIDLSKESFKTQLPNKAEQRKRDHQESLLQATTSLYEHLMRQVLPCFDSKEEIHLAEWIIGHLNEKGFLDTPLSEIAPHVPQEKLEQILKIIQTLDPPGVGATSLQESLCLQLALSQKHSPLAEQILKEHFDDLLHNRISLIAKHLKQDTARIAKTIAEDIVPLDLHPGYRFSIQPPVAIVPDLFFLPMDGKWHVEVNTAFLPSFHISATYAKALQDTSLKREDSFYLRRQLSAGRWLKKIVAKRHTTLITIGQFILRRQSAFFNHESGTLESLTMQEAADSLQLNESTIARAVANKYVSCPEGIFSLRTFFHQGLSTTAGQKVSNHSLREMLKGMIEREDKGAPLSDEALSHQFHKWGIRCARRTITKYRAKLKIAPASQRRKF